MIPRFAVIPTNGERGCLRDCVAAIAPQVEVVFLVHNCPISDVSRHLPRESPGSFMFVPFVNNKPFNLSRAWNAGLVEAERTAWRWGGPGDHWVAILNDDAIVPPSWFGAVTQRMNQLGAAAGCSDAPNGEVCHRRSGPVSLFETMRGWAFILRGSLGLRADENMAYWYADNDLAWRAADAGGMVMIPGHPVSNLYPNGHVTPELQVQIAKDRNVFIEKWRTAPW